MLVRVLPPLSSAPPMKLPFAIPVTRRLPWSPSFLLALNYDHKWGWQVHMCNKLASRHVRVGLATPSDVPRCDICENAPAFFYCEIDGTSLCLQCDMVVHVGGKRTHGRYLLLRQRVEFPGDKLEDSGLQPMDRGEPMKGQNDSSKLTIGENRKNHRASPIPMSDGNSDGVAKMDNKMIDLNMKPHRVHEQA
ncbi:hypothetical protein K2173_006182 [Erythroxylum novogranatense]|uniref:B box-type domain-containing protein n=1 Tax=Erythroxylum novogranatense TaxID=1862640 RepID=A0AAV8TC56_9ROSI|nr:hypothetical protein K2173_006182 [Erythroxylum novogranatense]